MFRITMLPLASLALLAQEPIPPSTPATPTPPAQTLVSAPFHGVCIDDDVARDGRFWCRGDRYKMSFGSDGAAFVPLFSSRTPRHFPLAFHLAGATAAAPVRDGDGFVFHRDGIEERWALRPEGAEQSFELATRPAGDVLVIAVSTDLPFVGTDAKGLHFLAEGWGEVVYGGAVAIFDQRRLPLRTTFGGGVIRIDLPADASYPLTVDPFVSSIGVASNEPFDNRNPDVAFDFASDRWCVAMEERVSAFDTDIKVRRFSRAGVLLDTDYFETSGAVADQVTVGAATQTGAASRFLVVWRESSLDIVGRLIVADGTSPGTPHTFAHGSVALGSFALRPDVAGSSFGKFGLVLVLENTLLPPQLTFTIVGISATGGITVNGILNVVTTTGCVTPHVANALPPNHEWPVTWTRQLSGCLAGGVNFAVVNDLAAFELQPTTVSGSITADDRNEDVAWNGSEGLIVWDRDLGSHHDIIGQPFQRTPAGYSLVGLNRNLSALEPGIPLNADQRQPVVGSDGLRFAVAYLEGSTPRPFCATFAIDAGTVVCHEGHTLVAGPLLDHENLAIASSGPGDGLTQYLVVTDERDGLNDYDVQGAFYDGRQTGAFFTTVATGCTPVGFSEPQLAATGTSDLGHTFQVAMSGFHALPLVVAGVPENPTVSLCTVVLTQTQCRLGVSIPFLASSFGQSMTVQVPADVGLVGVTLAFQGIDVTATGACGSHLFGIAFAVTDTIQATVR